MKATELLASQHRECESLFTRLESGSARSSQLVSELADDLAAHMVIEQEIFYPAAREADESMVLESYEEHAVARFALQRLLEVGRENESFEARLATLKELIQHHVKEEESELFPEVANALGDERLEELGVEMKALFDRTKKAGHMSVLGKKGTKSTRRLANGKRTTPSRAHAHPRASR